jgi:magnesium-transporting ATPase (P-type)
MLYFKHFHFIWIHISSILINKSDLFNISFLISKNIIELILQIIYSRSTTILTSLLLWHSAIIIRNRNRHRYFNSIRNSLRNDNLLFNWNWQWHWFINSMFHWHLICYWHYLSHHLVQREVMQNRHLIICKHRHWNIYRHFHCLI